MANDSYPRAGDRSPSACAQREEYWRRALARQRQSGLSAAAFCRREEIRASALSWWVRELRERERVKPVSAASGRVGKKRSRSAFVPVRVIEAAPGPNAVSADIEIVTPGGHVLRLKPGFDPTTLRRALAALEGRPC